MQAMAKFKISLFGITRDIVGSSTIELELPTNTNVGALMESLKDKFPKLKEIRSVLVAVNSEYAEDNVKLSERDEIALIPPVSGG